MTTRRFPIRLTSAALAIAAALIVAAPSQAVEAAPSALETPTPAPAAGSCTNPAETGADVSYRWRSRAAAWRVRPAFTRVASRVRPAGGAARNGTLALETVHTGTAAYYLVLDARQVAGNCWLRVRLPATTVNTRAGWVLRDQVVLQRTAWQVEVDLSDRMVRLYRGGRVVTAKRAVIGTAGTPTPVTGTTEPFAMYDATRGSASSFTGTWQLATTAVSEVDAGLGRIGLHGRGGASLQAALGSAASAGCVRTDNATVDALVRTVGLGNLFGVPVVIRR